MSVRLFVVLALLSGWAQGQVRVKLADGFDFPVGKPNAAGYYKARGIRLTPPVHFGEDWNGTGGGDSDLHDPIYAVADGVVTFAADVRVGWGRVVLIRHAYRDPATGQVKYCDSQYGHLRTFLVKKGDMVKRGQKIGTMGNNRGMYAAHLHFEIRHNLRIGMWRESVARSWENWADPTAFIKKYRRLKREWRPVVVPTGTYREYRGNTGL
ncbi:MAG: murein hydrolase activator EnvC family protein [Verrucomicrobiaceae bacterium]